MGSALVANNLTKTYPATDLETTYKYLLRIRDLIKRGQAMERVELREGLDFKSDSGRASSIISALLHFGLLDKKDKQYLPTKLAIDLLLATEKNQKDRWRELGFKAATTPKLFNQLYSRFKATLPHDIKTRLSMGYRIKGKQVESVIKNYQKSLEFAEALSPLDESVEIVEPISALAQIRLISFPFPLSDGTLVTLNLPSSLSGNDARRLSQFLETLVITGGKE